MLASSISRNAILLGLFALATTMLIAGTQLGTKDRIDAAIRAAEQRALLEIVPIEVHDNTMLDDVALVEDKAGLLGSAGKLIYRARMAGVPVAAIVPVTAPDGYSGAIDLVVGIKVDGSIAGVRALSHKETPGLGDKVDIKKSDWVTGFEGRSLTDPAPARWRVKKDKGVFDQFTGATITPRAVTKAVYQALQYYERNSDQIWADDVDQESIDSGNG